MFIPVHSRETGGLLYQTAELFMSAQRRSVTLDFQIEQEVSIKEIPGKTGRVIAIFMDGGGTQYKVRYIYEGDPKEVYFYACELEPAE
jgi:hypothetical protein